MAPNYRRIHHDLADLQRCDCELISGLTTLDTPGHDLPTVRINILGPPNSLYAGEPYTLQVRFPENYPFTAPLIKFVGPSIPSHPHIYSNGHICVSTLGEDWSPANTLTSVCLSLISMLGSAETKSRPPDDRIYSAIAPEYPKSNIWLYHDYKA